MPAKHHLQRLRGLHPLHALLLAFPIAFLSAALASDITYLNTAEIQWSNFSAWLLAGAALFGAVVVIWAFAAWLSNRRHGRGGWSLAYLILVLLMWVTSVVNSFQHSRDGWSSVETTGLLLSILGTLLALAAGWIGYAGVPRREVLP